MENNIIKITTIDEETHSHIGSCVECYYRTHINTSLPDDVLFRLYLYAYEEENISKSPLCAPNKFSKVTSNGDAWSDILLSTSLADVFGIEQKDYKLNVSEALNSTYVCLVLAGKYILCKPKVHKKGNSHFWCMLDNLLCAYEIDKKSKTSQADKTIIADYLGLDFSDESNKVPKWLVYRRKISKNELLKIEEKKDKIVDAIKKISLNFDSLTILDKIKKNEKNEKIVRDTAGKEKNHIRFKSYLAPLIRASYASAYKFPYLPNRSVYTTYKKYEDTYDSELGIDEKSYICLNRIIRYKDYKKSTKNNIKTYGDSFLKNYFSVLRCTFESLSKSDSTGARVYYRCNGCSCEFMDDKAYFYLTEKVYGYYLFRYEAQLIKEQEVNFESWSHEKKRLLKRALKYIFLYCPGVFARLQAADEAIRFIFKDSFEITVPDEEKETEAKAQMRLYMTEQNSVELKKILNKFSYKNFAKNEDKAIKSLLLRLYPKEGKISITGTILNETKMRMKEFKDNTGMIEYYQKCLLNEDILGYEENIDDNNDFSKHTRTSKSYERILCWIIKKSMGNKWYHFFDQIE